MKTRASVKLTVIRRSASNAHRYFCVINGKFRTILTHEKDALSTLASLFGYLNQFSAWGQYTLSRLAATWFLATVFIGSVFCFRPAYALPTDYQTAAGNVQFQQPDVNTLNITSQSNKAIVDYRTFNIAGHETVNILLPNAASSILNRVVGGVPSEILGKLNSNGNVFLVNPSGIIFGSSAQVNVGSMFASTLGISNQDYLAGRYHFKQETPTPAAIENHGRLQAKPGGSIVMAAGAIQNTGTIEAPLGKVELAVGQEIALAVDKDVWVDVRVDKALQRKVDEYQDAIENSGTLSAPGGKVKLDAELRQQFYERAINNRSVIQADGFEEHNGVIELVAHSEDGGAVIRNTGLVDANGDAFHEGEVITLDGDLIEQAGTIQADGGEGGQGGDITITSRQGTQLASGSITSAKGNAENSRGGRINIWSDQNTRFERGAKLDVSGGRTSGDGGFAEVSARKTVFFEGQAKGTANQGKGGRILIDPTNVRIVAVDPNSGSASIPYTDPDNGAGESTFQADTFSGFASVNIEATNNIAVESAFDLSSVTGGNSLTLKAGNNISIQAPTSTAGGDINLIADGDFSGTGGAASDGNGSVFITATGSLNSMGGNISISGATADIDSTINAGAGSVMFMPSLNTRAIELGGGTLLADPEPGAAFGISSPELGQITASSITLGTTSNTGGITLQGNTSIAGLFDLSLATGGNYNSNTYSVTLGAKTYSVNAFGTLTSDAVTGIAGSVLNLSSRGLLTTNGAISPGSYTLQTTLNNSNLILGGNITANTTGTLTAHGSGTITQSAGSIIGGAIAISSTSGALGSAMTPLQTNLASLTLNTSGSAYVTENSGLTLGASTVGDTLQLAAGGSILTSGIISSNLLDLSTTAGNGAITFANNATGTTGITLTTNGSGNVTVNNTFALSTTASPITIVSNDIDLSGSLSAAGGTVTLRPNGNKDIKIADNADLDGDDATFDVNTTELSNITATSLVIGNTGQTGGLTVAGNKDISGLYNLTLNNGGNINANGTTLTLGAKTLTETATGTLNTGAITGGAGAINLTSSGAMTVSGAVTGTGTVSLNGLGIALGGNVGGGTTTTLTSTGAGAITQSAGTVSGTTLNLVSNTGDIGTNMASIATDAGTLTANSTSGNVYLIETNGLTLGASTVGGTFQLASGGNIVTSGAVSSNLLNLSTTAGNGSITFGNNATGTTGITLATNGSGNVTVNNTFALSTTASPISISANNLDLSGTLSAAGSTVTLTPNGNKDIRIADNADLDGDDATFDINTTELSNITATNLIIGNTAQTGGLTVGGSKDISALYNLTLNNGGNINATGTTLTLGTKTLTETTSGTLATGGITGGAGAVTLTSSGVLTVTDDVTGTGTVALTGLGIVLGDNVGGGTTTNLTATGVGTITQSAGTVSGTTLNLVSNSGDIGTSMTSIGTAAGTLTANSTSGNVYLIESNGLTLGASTVGGTFQLASGGNIVTSGAVSSNLLNLSTTAGNGSITFGNNATGTTGITLATNGSGNVTVNNTFSLSTTASPISISANNLDLSGTLSAAGSTVTLTPNGNKDIKIADNADLDGDDATFDVNTTELNNITAANLVVGNTGQTGGLTVAGNKDISALYNLTLNNGGNIDATGTVLTLGTKTLTETATGTLATGGITGGAGAVTLTSSGVLTVTDDVTGTGTVALTGLGIVLGDNVGGGTTTNLTATGAGTITQSAGTVSGTTINLVSNSGDIGTNMASIATDTGTLTANSTSGNVYVTETNGLTLGASTVGGTFQLASGGNIVTSGAVSSNLLNFSTTAGNGSITFGNNATGTTGITLTTNGSGNVTVNNTFALSTTASPISITANNLDLSGTLSAAGSTVTLKPNGNKDIAVADNADSDGDDATFDINSAELGRITTGTLTIGDTQTGGLTVLGDINLTGGYNLALTNGGNITANNRLFTLGGRTLAINANSADVSITNTSGNTGINATSISGRNITLTTTGATSPINVSSNITSTGDLTLSTLNSNITVGGNISNTGGAGSTVYLYAGTTTPSNFDLTGSLTISDSGTKNVTLATGTGSLFSSAFFNAAHSFGNIDYRTYGANTPITIGANLSGQTISIASTGTNNQITQTAGAITGSTVTLTSDQLTLNGNLTVTGGGTLTLQPANAGTTIGLGGGTGLFNLTNAEFSRMSAGTIVIGGNTTAGTIDIGNLDLTSTGADLTLKTTGTITDNDTADDSMANLTLATNKNLTITGGAGTGSGQIGDTGNGDLDIALGGGTGLLAVKTNNADVYINSTNDLLLGLVDAGTGRINLEASNNSSILDGNGDTVNLIAGANSSLRAGNGTASTIGTDLDALEVNITNGSLTVQASGDVNGVAVNINGTVSPSNTLTPLGTFINQVYFNTYSIPTTTTDLTGQVSVPYLLANNPAIPLLQTVITGADLEEVELRLDQQIVREASVMDWFMDEAEANYQREQAQQQTTQQAETQPTNRPSPSGEYNVNDSPNAAPTEERIIPAVEPNSEDDAKKKPRTPSKKALLKEILEASWNFREPLHGVHGQSIDIKPPVQVRPSGKTSGADVPYHLALLDEIPFLHPELGHMNIDGTHPLAMIQAYRATMKAKHFRDLNLPGRDGFDGTTGRSA